MPRPAYGRPGRGLPRWQVSHVELQPCGGHALVVLNLRDHLLGGPHTYRVTNHPEVLSCEAV